MSVNKFEKYPYHAALTSHFENFWSIVYVMNTYGFFLGLILRASPTSSTSFRNGQKRKFQFGVIRQGSYSTRSGVKYTQYETREVSSW